MLAAVLLAAGQANRMGQLKQIMLWKEGRTLLQVSLDNILACSEITGAVRVVIGAEAEKVRPILAGYSDSRLELRQNPDYQRGMLSSIKTGLAGLPRNVEGFFIALADQPLISPAVYSRLSRAFRQESKKIVVPTYRSRRGHPVLLDRCFQEEIMGMPDRQGGLRPLVDRYREQLLLLDLEQPGIIIDLDNPADYHYYRRRENG